jgi:acetolactate synthase small subunit
MQVFHVRYRNAQGTLMRILNAVSRRGLDLTSVHAEYAGHDHLVTLLLETPHKQIGQLYREWYAIVDVIDVRSSTALRDHEEAVWAPHPPASVAEESARAARA